MTRRRKHEYVDVDGKIDATLLAEHGRDWSTYTLMYPGERWVATCIPNTGCQELVESFGKAVIEHYQ